MGHSSRHSPVPPPRGRWSHRPANLERRGALRCGTRTHAENGRPRLDDTSANIGRAILEGVLLSEFAIAGSAGTTWCSDGYGDGDRRAAKQQLWTQCRPMFRRPCAQRSAGDPTLRGAAFVPVWPLVGFEDIKPGSRESAVTKDVHEPSGEHGRLHDYFSAYKAIQTTLATEQLNNRIAHLPRGNV